MELNAFSYKFYILHIILYIAAVTDFPHVPCHLEGLCTRTDLKQKQERA